jgi:hypothetical protein
VTGPGSGSAGPSSFSAVQKTPHVPALSIEKRVAKSWAPKSA